VRASHRVEGFTVDIKGEGELSGQWVGSRIRIRFSIRSTGEIG